jgi:hypothetical protein
VWGAGPGHFDYRFGAYRPEYVQRRPGRVHNDYLNTLADWGVAGAALVAAALALLAVGVFKTWRFVRLSPDDLNGRGRSNRFAVVLGAAIGLVAILAHSVVDFNMHIPANAILAVTLMALLSGSLRFATERYWHPATTLTRTLLLGALIVGGIFLAGQGTRLARERRWLARAEGAPQVSFERIAAFEQALAIEPRNFDTTYALGETLRAQSWLGGEDYEEWARKAMTWFERGMRLNLLRRGAHGLAFRADGGLRGGAAVVRTVPAAGVGGQCDCQVLAGNYDAQTAGIGDRRSRRPVAALREETRMVQADYAFDFQPHILRMRSRLNRCL